MIKLLNIDKTYNYKKPNAFKALKNISLKIDDGEMVAVIGKSGSGKTTLLNIIGCLDEFEKGEYMFENTSVKSTSQNEKAEMRSDKIGIVMQDFSLIESYTALENVMIPTAFSGSRYEEKASARALAALKSVGMDEMAKKPVNKLSGGQKQRVAIARAIVNAPSVILADEPTGALDSKTAEEIMGVFKQLNEQGKTVIIVTHDMGVAQQCDRIIEISDGEIVAGASA